MTLARRVVVAWNAEFDRRVLDQTCDAWGVRRLELNWECALARYADYGGRWRVLDSACRVEGIDVEGRHTALGDARLARRVVLGMTERPDAEIA